MNQSQISGSWSDVTNTLLQWWCFKNASDKSQLYIRLILPNSSAWLRFEFSRLSLGFVTVKTNVLLFIDREWKAQSGQTWVPRKMLLLGIKRTSVSRSGSLSGTFQVDIYFYDWFFISSFRVKETTICSVWGISSQNAGNGNVVVWNVFTAVKPNLQGALKLFFFKVVVSLAFSFTVMLLETSLENHYKCSWRHFVVTDQYTVHPLIRVTLELLHISF